MPRPAITVERLSKAYRIGLREDVPDSFVGAATAWLRAPMRNLERLRRLNTFEGHGHDADTLWALEDVSFDVAEGDVVGVIGRNGAGKSTLLKILSRITEPTSGEARLHGRVSSLLEVGTGFHPELSGRDNVYMNGTILGMRKREIDRKFDEIVAFSGVERFLDTPVKRYSSGMTVRLAFAVAAHLEPEILIVDEVLAVGDAEFQRKCLGKMHDVARGGRTVLFVSHNMAAVQALCDRGILLEAGRLALAGSTDDVVRAYLAGRHGSAPFTTGAYIDLSERENEYTPGKCYIRGVSLHDGTGAAQEVFATGQPLQIRIDMQDARSVRGGQVGAIFKSTTDQWLGMINTGMCPPTVVEDADGQVAVLTIPRLPFVPGTYWIDLSLAVKSHGRVDFVERAARLDVCEYDVYGSGYTVKERDGCVYIDGSWEVLSRDDVANARSCSPARSSAMMAVAP